MLQSKVDVAAAQLQADNDGVSAALNQIQNQATTAAGLAPELTPVAQQIADTVGQLAVTYQADPGNGAAFAAAADAWALGQGVQQITDLMAQSTGASNGLAAAIAANVQALLTVVQSLAQSAVADAQVLADAQAALDACNAAG